MCMPAGMGNNCLDESDESCAGEVKISSYVS